MGELLYGQCEVLHERSGKLITIMSGTGARAPHYDSSGSGVYRNQQELGWSIRASSERKRIPKGPRPTARFRTSSSRERLFVSTQVTRGPRRRRGREEPTQIRRNLDPHNMRETSWHPDRPHQGYQDTTIPHPDFGHPPRLRSVTLCHAPYWVCQ